MGMGTEVFIKELCMELARTGSLDTSEEKLIEYQDIIGHSNTGTLEEIANTPELIESFYRIYGAAYGTPAAIKYYVEHSDRQIEQREELADAKETLEKKDARIKELEEGLRATEESIRKNKEFIQSIEVEAKRYEEIIRADKDENTRLKAELYDLMKENEVMRRTLAERS